MSMQPTFIEVDIPNVEQALEVCIGFSWGGDATKQVAPADESAFKEAVLEAIEATLEIDRRLILDMAEESSLLNGKYRYRGGHTREAIQALVDIAVESVTQVMPLPRPCAAVVVQR